MNAPVRKNRPVAFAMIAVGMLVELTAIVFLARGIDVAAGMAVLIPGLFLTLGGVILLVRPHG